MFGAFFHAGPVTSLETAKAADGARFKKFFHAMLKRGVYMAPSAFEAGFVSMAHTEQDIARTVECVAEALEES